MATRIVRTVGLAAAAVLLAGTAQAQGKKHDRDDGRSRMNDVTIVRGPETRHRDVHVRRVDDDRYRDRDRFDRRIPPGLAKKPGQMPPGQFKKRYRAYEGSSVLSDILRRRGDRVVRIVPSGESQYVYYRQRDGGDRWVLVRPGEDRLYFDNAPTSLLQAVLARLY